MIDKQLMLDELNKSHQLSAWTNELTRMMYELSEGVASHRLFNNYPLGKEDLTQDGILFLIQNWKKYDVNNASKNPFGYFTHCLFRYYMLLMKKEFKYINLKSDIEEYIKCNGINWNDE